MNKLLFFLFSAFIPFALAEHTIMGQAFDVDSMEKLYQEHHTYSPDHTTHDVKYIDVLGSIIAEKTLSYPDDTSLRHQPDFKHTDHRHALSFSSKTLADSIQMTRTELGRSRNKSVDKLSTSVVDAGFNMYIQNHWDDILRTPHDVAFVLAGKLRQLDLTIEAINASESAFPDDIKSQPWTFIRCEPQGFLIGFIVPPIYLAYDEQQRLRAFMGISNINDEHNKRQHVVIRYTYQ